MPCTQVQQRRGRLEAAAQHGILAAARKLLLLMLQLMWAGVRRSYRAWLAASSPAAPGPAPVGSDDSADGGPPEPTSPTPGSLSTATPGRLTESSAAMASAGPVARTTGNPRTPPSESWPAAAAAARSRSCLSRAEAPGETAGGQPGAVRGVSRSSNGQAVQAPAARRSLSSPVGSAGASRGSHAALAAEGGLSPHRPNAHVPPREGQQEETQHGTASPAAAASAGGRRPRYHGLLAQLAEGLSEADTTLEDPTAGPVPSGQQDLGLSGLEALFDEVLASADEAMGGEVGGSLGSGTGGEREQQRGSMVDRRAREPFPGPSERAAAAGDAAGGGLAAGSREQDTSPADTRSGTVSETVWIYSQALGRRHDRWAQPDGGGAAAGADSGSLLRASWQPGQQAPGGLEGGRRSGPQLHGGVLLRSSFNGSAAAAAGLSGVLGTGGSGGFDAATSAPPGSGNAHHTPRRGDGGSQTVARDTQTAAAVDGSACAAAGASGTDPGRDPHARRSLQALQSALRPAAAGEGGCAGPEPASGRGGDGAAADGPCVRTDCRMRRVLQAQQLRNLQVGGSGGRSLVSPLLGSSREGKGSIRTRERHWSGMHRMLGSKGIVGLLVYQPWRVWVIGVQSAGAMGLVGAAHSAGRQPSTAAVVQAFLEPQYQHHTLVATARGRCHSRTLLTSIRTHLSPPPFLAPSPVRLPLSCPQSQLSRCQEAQAQLQGEVGQLLDSLTAARASHEQVRRMTGYTHLFGSTKYPSHGCYTCLNCGVGKDSGLGILGAVRP